jgi:hypothetical protein
MGKLTVTVVAALLAGAAILGAAAVTRTVSLGAGQTKTADAAIQTRVRQLDRFEASLRRQLGRKPPRLPAVPKPTAAAAPVPAAPPRVVYRRPAPIVIVRHTHHGDDGGESEAASGGGGDD